MLPARCFHAPPYRVEHEEIATSVFAEVVKVKAALATRTQEEPRSAGAWALGFGAQESRSARSLKMIFHI